MRAAIHLDDDLEGILDALWRKKPEITVDYAKVESNLLIVQELRNFQNALKVKQKCQT